MILSKMLINQIVNLLVKNFKEDLLKDENNKELSYKSFREAA